MQFIRASLSVLLCQQTSFAPWPIVEGADWTGLFALGSRPMPSNPPEPLRPALDDNEALVATLRIAEEVGSRRSCAVTSKNELDRHIVRLLQLRAAKINKRLRIHREGSIGDRRTLMPGVATESDVTPLQWRRRTW